VDICRHYLEILKMRMEDRLQVTIDVPTHLEAAAVPPLMLQSIVENAIRHGLEPKPEGGQLHLRAEVSEGRLAITVVDTGVGFSSVGLPSSGAPASSGVGLANIRERLAALFGERGRLMISPNLPHGSQVRLELPYATGGSK
jgi:sensor histidine kinase YesM